MVIDHKLIFILVILIYSGGSMAEKNCTMTDEDFEAAFKVHPGMRLDIQYSQNDTLKDDLYEIMQLYNFSSRYIIYEFDCSDMGCITWEILKSRGYDVYVALSSPTHEDLSHVWILVSASDGWVGIEPTGDLPHIGAVYTRHHKYNDTTKHQKNCILLSSPDELLSWWPGLELTPICEGIEGGTI